MTRPTAWLYVLGWLLISGFLLLLVSGGQSGLTLLLIASGATGLLLTVQVRELVHCQDQRRSMWRMWFVFGIPALMVPLLISAFLDTYVPSPTGMPLLLVSFWASLTMAGLVVVQRRFPQSEAFKTMKSGVIALVTIAGVGGIFVFVNSVRNPIPTSVEIIDVSCIGVEVPLPDSKQAVLTIDFDGQDRQIVAVKSGSAAFNAPVYAGWINFNLSAAGKNLTYGPRNRVKQVFLSEFLSIEQQLWTLGQISNDRSPVSFKWERNCPSSP